MNYRYHCDKCNKDLQIDIPMNKYSQLKDKQTCPECKLKVNRVIEWTGIAKGSGDGWVGARGTNVI